MPPIPKELQEEFQNFAGKLRKSPRGTHHIDLSGEPTDPRVAAAAWIFKQEQKRQKTRRDADRRLAR